MLRIQQKTTLLGKWQIFFLTFLSYAALHSMRMAYAQIKPQFQSAFHLTHFYLGVFDAAIYLSLGIGFLVRFKFQTKQNLTKTFFLFMTIACIAYLYIPLSSLLLKEKVKDSLIFKELLPGISLLVFGFCQFPAWPTLLIIINNHFDVQKEGDITGAWSACGDIGNILGLILSGVLITALRLKWEYLMLSVAVLNWLSTLIVYLNLDDSHHQSNTDEIIDLLQDEDEPVQSEFAQFWTFSKEIVQKQENKHFLLSMGLLKSILYGFLLWMPTYLTTNHYAYYKSTVPIVFNIGTLGGSFVLGYFYNNLEFHQKDLVSRLFEHLKIYSIFYSCLAVTAIFTIFYLFRMTIFVFFVLSFICGAFLGGSFNMLASNQAIAIVKGHQQHVSKLSTLSMAVGNLTVGLVQFIIGVVLDVKATSKGQNTLFVILVSIGAFCLLILLRRAHLLSENAQKEQQEAMT